MTYIIKISFRWAILVWCLTGGTSGGLAQSTGTITGTITDQTGARLAGVQVVCRNLESGLTVEATTQLEGIFRFAELPIGRYRLATSAEGFQQTVVEGVSLPSSQVVSVNLVLQVGQAETIVVMVPGELALSHLSESAVKTSMTQRQVRELPLNGRNLLNLMALTPGATISDAGSIAAQGQQDNRGLTVNGLRPTQNNVRLDSVSYTNRFFGSIPFLPNPDTVAEFTVQSANSNARLAGAGAVIELATRSGTNEFHGSGFEFLRHTVLNANNFFNNAAKFQRPPFTLHQYGLSLGGPIRRNRSFFFLAYQGTRQRSSPSSTVLTSLTAAERNGDFSTNPVPIKDPLTGEPFPGNRIPADRLDPVMRRVLEVYLPLPTDGNRLTARQDRDLEDDQFTVKLDHEFSSTLRLSGRYFRDFHRFKRVFPAPEGFFAANSFHNQSLALRLTRTLSSHVVVTVAGGFSRFQRIQEPQTRTLQTLQELGVKPEPSVKTDFFPGVRLFADPLFRLFSGGGLEQTPTTFDVHPTVALSFGKHFVQAGFDFHHDRLFTLDASFTPGSWFFNGQRTGLVQADVVLGLPSRFEQDSGRTNRLIETKTHFWIQDDWKVTPRLTLNLGVRYEPRLPPIDELNNLVGFAEGRQSIVAPDAPRGLVYPGDPGIQASVIPRDLNNFAPRVGLAFDLLGTGRTVLRAGFGLFFVDPALTIYTRTVSTQPSVLTAVVQNPASFADPYAGVAGGTPFPFNRIPPGEFKNFKYRKPVSGGVLDPATRTGYIQMWNLTVEHRLRQGMSLTAAYVGNLGVKILAARELNPARFGPGATTGNTDSRRLFTDLSAVEIASPFESANFHSLQTTVTQQAASGLTVLATYVWSKSIDNSSATVEGNSFYPRNSLDLASNRGPSDFDITQKVTIAAVYDLPRIKSDRWLVKAGLNHWQVNVIVNLQSGFPFTVKSGTDRSLSAVNQDHADQIGNPQRPEGVALTEQYFNRAAFLPAAVGTFGTVGRNSLRGPGFASMDCSLFKEFPLSDAVRLQIRAESFNFFNRVNFQNPVSLNPTATNFGKITSAFDPRVFQFGVKLIF